MHSPNLTIKKHPPEYKIHKYKSFTHSHLITSSRRAVQRNYKFEYAVAAIIWAPIFNDSWWWKIASVRLTGIEIKFNVNDGICVRHGMREKEGGGEGWSKQYQVSGATIANQWFRKNVIFKRCSLSSINEFSTNSHIDTVILTSFFEFQRNCIRMSKITWHQRIN